MELLWSWVSVVAVIGGALGQPGGRWGPRTRLLLDTAEPLYLPSSDLLPLRYPYAYLEDETNSRHAEDPYTATNQLFLRNLILSQMYEDAVRRPEEEEYDDTTGYVYGERVDEPVQGRRDEEVSQLDSLRRDAALPQPFWRDEKRLAAAVLSSTTERPSGQRETPVKRPDYQPSPYDSLKRLLQMQDKLDQDATAAKIQRKRSYVPSEQSLVQQLGNLKKSA